MTYRQRLRATRVLVLLGFVLGYAAYPVFKLGGPPELYPFFYWRLYSAPPFVEGASMYRIYSQAGPGQPWQRHSIEQAGAYDVSDYALVLTRLTEASLADSLGRTDSRERLRIFARHVVPEATRYRIVAETFWPRALLHDSTAYDTTTVLAFTP